MTISNVCNIRNLEQIQATMCRHYIRPNVIIMMMMMMMIIITIIINIIIIIIIIIIVIIVITIIIIMIITIIIIFVLVFLGGLKGQCHHFFFLIENPTNKFQITKKIS